MTALPLRVQPPRWELAIIDGKAVSGHYIYLRDAGALTDVELLGALGLHGYFPDPKPVSLSRSRFVQRLNMSPVIPPLQDAAKT